MIWALTGAAAAIYWALTLSEGHSVFRSAVKGLSVFPLAIAALVAGMPAMAMALALCSLGDVILSRPGDKAFLGGLIAFALGHLAWIAVFFIRLSPDPAHLSAPLAFALLLGLAVLAGVMVRVLLPNAGDLRLPVAVYIGIIIAMGICGLMTAVPLVVLGALAFAASDTLLGLQTFVLARGDRAERWANVLIWPLYWGAIVLLALGTAGQAVF
ncbi:lysoplasmalogenase [Sulfitobacter mediterraneus]|uniref:lysoplasmalogenase n=1 Tax=Sulfitobacter mediterraneus TaxID=83219 RepID=UPI001939AD10|nr:lysoplasmalogenase [Sulfitobacter mediterraneus]MBM1557437.1 lysoplasmalogenase [Sulfitobacter mediterraneus]MBM1568483.1 lysoplasmalogenase [Sulfitobacter mediterraneus]MBM1571914.1 lysoplasmalogenase [Sulfitobacter mediterraneus]MBM1575703.1 lysoplasmalogenase [Sulfitobacter mediterraneus]MBM1580025.1 lysoplasmalogenase [Sulfitobacter mediterraneus]